MSNKEISRLLRLTASLLEFHNENEFKAKSYTNAAFQIGKFEGELARLDLAQLSAVKGLGKSIAGQLDQLFTKGHFPELESLLEKTPEGIIELLGVKGLGGKKLAELHQQLGIESLGELQYACKENRLAAIKGFGAKTQSTILEQINFKLANAGKYLYATIIDFAEELVAKIAKETKCKTSLSGDLRRNAEIAEIIEIVSTARPAQLQELFASQNIENESISDESYTFKIQGINVLIYCCSEANFALKLFETTGSKDFIANFPSIPPNTFENEAQIFNSVDKAFVAPELREIELKDYSLNVDLLEYSQLKGILHNHTTASDGGHSLHEMAAHAKALGFQYLGISDHSQSAFYAGGLKADEIEKQHQEIDKLNKELSPFKVFKGIESDILFDGNLDYPNEILKTFDFIVASVHSVLTMNEEKATARLIAAIENPYTTILGHASGRLLLARKGYPLDYKKIIDACIQNQVVIELNANPRRLDIDWRWLPYALDKGALIAINPDAHSKEEYANMKYGVLAARKGLLSAAQTLNAFSLPQFEKFLEKQKSKR